MTRLEFVKKCLKETAHFDISGILVGTTSGWVLLSGTSNYGRQRIKNLDKNNIYSFYRSQ